MLKRLLVSTAALLALGSAAQAKELDLSGGDLTSNAGSFEIRDDGSFQIADARGRMVSHGFHLAQCPYAVDNGCAEARTYVAAPYWSDSNFAFDAAQSGQLPQSPTSAQIAQYNLALHCISWVSGTCLSAKNIPYMDYKIGSENPQNSVLLPPISSFKGDNYCSQVTTFGSQGQPTNAPYVLCQGSSSTAFVASGPAISLTSTPPAQIALTSLSPTTTVLKVVNSGTTSVYIAKWINANLPASGQSPTIIAAGATAYLPVGLATYISAYTTSASPSVTVTPGYSTANETLANWDFTNGGTASVLLIVKNTSSGPGVNYTFTNLYNQANSFSGYQGNGLAYSTWWGTAGTPEWLVELAAANSGGVPNMVTFNNVTYDGNYGNAPFSSYTGSISGISGTSPSTGTLTTTTTQTFDTGEAVLGPGVSVGTYIYSGGTGTSFTVRLTTGTLAPVSNVAMFGGRAAGRMNAIQDNREGGYLPYEWPLAVNYSLIMNFGHNPIQAADAGNVLWNGSALLNNCQSGIQWCHGETEEATGIYANREADYISNLFFLPSSYYSDQGLSAAYYLTSGNSGNNTFTAKLIGNTQVINLIGCTNPPTGGSTTNFVPGGVNQYGANNRCQGGSQNGEALFSLDYDTQASLTIAANTIDGTGAGSCAANTHNTYPTPTTAPSGGFQGSVQTAGSIFTITTPATNYSNSAPPVSAWWNGMLLVDASNPSWVDALISSYGTYGNTGSPINNTSSCAPGTNPGCGTLNLSASEPATNPSDTYYTYANVLAMNDAGNNYSVGGAYGTHVPTAISWPQVTTTPTPWTNGTVSCP